MEFLYNYAVATNRNITATQGQSPIWTQTRPMFGYKATNRKNNHNV